MAGHRRPHRRVDIQSGKLLRKVFDQSAKMAANGGPWLGQAGLEEAAYRAGFSRFDALGSAGNATTYQQPSFLISIIPVSVSRHQKLNATVLDAMDRVGYVGVGPCTGDGSYARDCVMLLALLSNGRHHARM